MRAAKVQASLRIRAVSPEPSLLAHTSSESRGTFRQTARSLAPLNGWACAVKICHDGMLEDTNSLDGAHLSFLVKYLQDSSLQTSLRWEQICKVTEKLHLCYILFKHNIKQCESTLWTKQKSKGRTLTFPSHL